MNTPGPEWIDPVAFRCQVHAEWVGLQYRSSTAANQSDPPVEAVPILALPPGFSTPRRGQVAGIAILSRLKR